MNGEAPLPAKRPPWAWLVAGVLLAGASAAGLWARAAELLPRGPGLTVVLVLAWSVPLAWALRALEKGKPAPALRSSVAPWVFLGITHLCVQLSGGLSSPLFSAYTLVLFIAARHHGWQALLMALAVSVLEGWPLAKAEAGERAALLPGWVELVGVWAGAGLGMWARVGVATPGLRGPVEMAPNYRPGASGQALLAPREEERSSGAEEEVLGVDAGAVLEREQSMLVDLGFHSHPQWNALGLWLGDAQEVERKLLKLRSGQASSARRVAAGEGMIGLCLKEKRAVSVTDMAPTVASQLPYYAGATPVKGICTVPLLDEGELRGVLVCDKLEAGGFTPEESAAMDTLAKQLVERGQTSAYLRRLQAQGQRYSSLYGAIRELASDLESEALLVRFAEVLKRLVPFDSYFLALAPESGDGFEVVARLGYDGGSEGPDLGSHGTLASFLRAGGEAMAFNAEGGAQVPSFLTQGLLEAADAFLLAPLTLSGRLSGVLKLARKGRPYSQQEKELALILASQAAVTLEHARLYTLHRRLATTDGLTGLYNHRYFQERLALELEKAERSQKPLSLALTDIDHFKKFNDTFGHQEGDVVLKRVAKLVQEKVRPGQDIVCRYGGEEFVVVLPDCDVVEARAVLDALRAHSAKHLIGGQGPEARAITLSVGICTYPSGAKDQRSLIHVADEALYKAKRTGRDKVCSFKDLP